MGFLSWLQQLGFCSLSNVAAIEEGGFGFGAVLVGLFLELVVSGLVVGAASA